MIPCPRPLGLPNGLFVTPALTGVVPFGDSALIPFGGGSKIALREGLVLAEMGLLEGLTPFCWGAAKGGWRFSGDRTGFRFGGAPS